MAKFLESNIFTQFCNLARILDFAEDPNYADSARQRQFDKISFNLFIDNDGQFRLYKGGKTVLAGAVASAEDQARLVEASRDQMYKTREDWLASRVTAAATYRRLADERMEAAHRDLVQFMGLEASLTRSLHDLRKTAQIAKEGHQ